MLLEPLNGLRLSIMPFGGILGHFGASTGLTCANRSNSATLKVGHSSRLLPTFGGLWGSPKCCWSL